LECFQIHNLLGL